MDIVTDFLCSTGKAAKETAASNAARGLMEDLGQANGAAIFASNLMDNIIKTIKSDARTVPGSQFLNPGIHKVKQNFFAALKKRWIREKVLGPLYTFMYRITDPWAFVRSVMTADDIEALRGHFNANALGFDALSPERENGLRRFTELLNSNGDFGRTLIAAIEQGQDIFGLHHAALDAPRAPQRRGRRRIVPPSSDEEEDDDEQEPMNAEEIVEQLMESSESESDRAFIDDDDEEGEQEDSSSPSSSEESSFKATPKSKKRAKLPPAPRKNARPVKQAKRVLDLVDDDED